MIPAKQFPLTRRSIDQIFYEINSTVRADVYRAALHRGDLVDQNRGDAIATRFENVSVGDFWILRLWGLLLNLKNENFDKKKKGRKRESRFSPSNFPFFSFPTNYDRAGRLKTKSLARALVQQIIGRVF